MDKSKARMLAAGLTALIGAGAGWAQSGQGNQGLSRMLQPVYDRPVMVAAATSAPLVRQMTFGLCELFAANSEGERVNTHSLNKFTGMMEFLSLQLKENIELGLPDAQAWAMEWEKGFRTSVLLPPQHGRLINEGTNPDPSYAVYRPDLGYIGKDRIDLLVESKDDLGRPVALTMRYFINVIPAKELQSVLAKKAYSQAIKKHCGTRSHFWRIQLEMAPVPGSAGRPRITAAPESDGLLRNNRGQTTTPTF